MTRFSQYWVDPDAELQQIFEQEREIKETQIIKNHILKLLFMKLSKMV